MLHHFFALFISIKIFFPGYSKTVSHVVIGLKTAKGTKQLKLDPSIYESLQKERVEVLYIETVLCVRNVDMITSGRRCHLH